MAREGSSPLTRGALKLVGFRRHYRGLIPAHAGSTLCAPKRREPRGAHPRSRGEHLISSPQIPHIQGSSPLTRGAPKRTRTNLQGLRLIPAHAGSTRPAPSTSKAARAHPRSRGEHLHRWHELAPLSGSSPLTRGALRARSHRVFSVGLIPAHAGSTLFVNSRQRHRCGSSPLTRGAHLLSSKFSSLTLILHTASRSRERARS